RIHMARPFSLAHVRFFSGGGCKASLSSELDVFRMARPCRGRIPCKGAFPFKSARPATRGPRDTGEPAKGDLPSALGECPPGAGGWPATRRVFSERRARAWVADHPNNGRRSWPPP